MSPSYQDLLAQAREVIPEVEPSDVAPRVESGDGPLIMENYRIPGHPVTLLFDRTGKETRRFVGPDTVENIELAIEQTLKNQED